jgi:hypothetical protein
MCDPNMHMGRYDHPEVVLTLFRSIRFQSYAVESQIRKQLPLLYPALNSTNVCCWRQSTILAPLATWLLLPGSGHFLPWDTLDRRRDLRAAVRSRGQRGD